MKVITDWLYYNIFYTPPPAAAIFIRILFNSNLFFCCYINGIYLYLELKNVEDNTSTFLNRVYIYLHYMNRFWFGEKYNPQKNPKITNNNNKTFFLSSSRLRYQKYRKRLCTLSVGVIIVEVLAMSVIDNPLCMYETDTIILCVFSILSCVFIFLFRK